MADVNQKVRLVFSGAGGQGVITAAIILAEAAALHEGLTAVQSQSYGPEARGGATRSDVIISSSEIMFPKVNQPNILICLTQEACDKYVDDLKEDGLLIADSRAVRTLPKGAYGVIAVPIAELAENEIGRSMTANMIALGIVVGATQVVKPRSVEMAISARVPRGSEELNLKAFRLGLEASENDSG